MTTPRNLSGYLPWLLGPVKIFVNGVLMQPRGKWNFKGGASVDDDGETLNIIIPRGNTDLALVAGVQSVAGEEPTRVAERVLRLTDATRATLYVSVEVTDGTGEVTLYNMTEDEEVDLGTPITTTSLTSEEFARELTIGTEAGNLRDGDQYQLRLELTGATESDRVICSNAVIVLEFD